MELLYSFIVFTYSHISYELDSWQVNLEILKTQHRYCLTDIVRRRHRKPSTDASQFQAPGHDVSCPEVIQLCTYNLGCLCGTHTALFGFMTIENWIFFSIVFYVNVYRIPKIYVFLCISWGMNTKRFPWG